MRLQLSLAGALCASGLACGWMIGPAPQAERYRLTDSGGDWTVSDPDRVRDDLRPRYPDYFARVLDSGSGEIDLRPLRYDLERAPVDHRNYDALNAVAIGYFELNSRAETLRDSGASAYLGGSMQVARLVAVPWRAYREIEDGALRDAILDFFADAASGAKPGSSATNARLVSVVESLEKHEADTERKARIRAIVASLAASAAP